MIFLPRKMVDQVLFVTQKPLARLMQNALPRTTRSLDHNASHMVGLVFAHDHHAVGHHSRDSALRCPDAAARRPPPKTKPE
jgi:hypothetical protein